MGVLSLTSNDEAEECEHGLCVVGTRFPGEALAALDGIPLGASPYRSLRQDTALQTLEVVVSNTNRQTASEGYGQRMIDDRLIPSQALDLRMRWMSIPMHSPLNPPLPLAA